jgi:hypothetical protein
VRAEAILIAAAIDLAMGEPGAHPQNEQLVQALREARCSR